MVTPKQWKRWESLSNPAIPHETNLNEIYKLFPNLIGIRLPNRLPRVTQ